jgi:hypothetical protein
VQGLPGYSTLVWFLQEEPYCITGTGTCSLSSHFHLIRVRRDLLSSAEALTRSVTSPLREYILRNAGGVSRANGDISYGRAENQGDPRRT